MTSLDDSHQGNETNCWASPFGHIFSQPYGDRNNRTPIGWAVYGCIDAKPHPEGDFPHAIEALLHSVCSVSSVVRLGQSGLRLTNDNDATCRWGCGI